MKTNQNHQPQPDEEAIIHELERFRAEVLEAALLILRERQMGR